VIAKIEHHLANSFLGWVSSLPFDRDQPRSSASTSGAGPAEQRIMEGKPPPTGRASAVTGSGRTRSVWSSASPPITSEICCAGCFCRRHSGLVPHESPATAVQNGRAPATSSSNSPKATWQRRCSDRSWRAVNGSYGTRREKKTAHGVSPRTGSLPAAVSPRWVAGPRHARAAPRGPREPPVWPLPKGHNVVSQVPPVPFRPAHGQKTMVHIRNQGSLRSRHPKMWTPAVDCLRAILRRTR
jgi:hypothetical protein